MTCKKRPKHIPYGSKRKEHWCDVCDKHLANSINKKAERSLAKKNIEKEMDTIKDKLIEEIYNNSVKLYYTLADNRMQSCGHPGIQGPAGGDAPWDHTEALLKSAIITLQACLRCYEEPS